MAHCPTIQLSLSNQPTNQPTNQLTNQPTNQPIAPPPKKGITATLVCFPLDTLRTRMMAPGSHHRYGGPLATLRGIARYEGLGALYAGCVPAVIGMAPAGAVFYGVYDMLKSRHLKGMAEAAALAEEGRGGGKQQQQRGRGSSGGGGPAVSAVAPELPAAFTLLYGALAGVAAEAVVYPLEVLRRRMQLQCAPAAAGGAAGGAAALLRHHAAGAAGAAGAGAAAWAAPPSAAAMGRIAMAAAAIWKEGGVAGFYAGLRPSLLQVLPSAALSYWVSHWRALGFLRGFRAEGCLRMRLAARVGAMARRLLFTGPVANSSRLTTASHQVYESVKRALGAPV